MMFAHFLTIGRIAALAACGKLTDAIAANFAKLRLPVIEISNVTKRFYSLTALNQVSLKIPRGEVVGLLGPNGAGKTTLFKLVAGILSPDSGRIRPTGKGWPPIGYKPERLIFPNHLRVGQYLALVGQLTNIPKTNLKRVVSEGLDKVGLGEAAHKKIGDCSKGMRQRLALAQALIGDPPLLLLDEPSNGLDPGGQVEIHRCIQELHDAGKTILMSSHQLHEVVQVCTQLVILNHGQVKYQGNIAEALAARSHTIIRTDRELSPVSDPLRTLHPDIYVNGTTLVLRNEAMDMRRQVLRTLLQADFDIIHVEQKRITLDEIYAEAVQ
jgi:ABC-2 type transport system ATP-binding protein